MRDDGTEVGINVKPRPGLVAFPSHFDFRVVPRHDKHVELIRQFEREHPWEASDAELLRQAAAYYAIES